MYRLRLIILCCLFLIGLMLTAQTLTPELARAELARRGLDEQDVTSRMLEKGIDLNTLDFDNPENVAQAQLALQEVINEIEAEKRAQIEENQVESTSFEADGGNEESEIEHPEDTLFPEDDLGEEEILTEEILTVYGKHLFKENRLKLYKSSDLIKPPSTYILGPGDKIVVNIWGTSEESALFEVAAEGYIKPSRLPRIYISGLSIDKAKTRLKDFYSRYYQFRNEDFEVTLATARAINISILGDAENVGSFNISAANSAFNALVAGGGPNEIGSVRNIELIRPGQNLKVDIYKFLTNPSVQSNYQLFENDILYIPVAQKIVAISGAVKRPAKYELLENEHLIELIDYCGGLTDRALLQNIQVTRIENDKEIIVDFSLKKLLASNQNYKLQPGDHVRINFIPGGYKNFVSVEGPVTIPGDYAFVKGMKLADVFTKTELLPHAQLDSAYIIRKNDDLKTVKYIAVSIQRAMADRGSDANVNLQPLDMIHIFEKGYFVDEESFQVTGEVRNPGSFSLDKQGSLRLSDAVLLAGGLQDDADDIAFLHRPYEDNPSLKEYFRISIRDIVKAPGGNNDILLKPDDELVIYSTTRYIDTFSVSIGGAVREPQILKYDPSLTLSDMVTLAGGLKVEASPKRVEVFRLSFDDDKSTQTLAAALSIDNYGNIPGQSDFTLQPFDKIYIRSAPEFELQRIVHISGEVRYPGEYALLDKNESLSSLIDRAGGLTHEAFEGGATLYRTKDKLGNVILDLEAALNNNQSEQNIILQEYDRITIPKIQNLVSIVGATKANELYPPEVLAEGKISVPFEKGKNVKYYLEKYAGGIGDNSKPSLVSVQHPNGEIQKTSSFLFIRSYPEVRPGSEIRVGSKPIEILKEEKEKEPVNWEKIVGNTIAQATSILSLVLLLQNLD